MPPCSCTTGDRWTATRPDGTIAVYRTLGEAQADATRNGGTFAKTA